MNAPAVLSEPFNSDAFESCPNVKDALRFGGNVAGVAIDGEPEITRAGGNPL
ncbi:MAG: hypothetical protein II832_03405 [Synergistaceae bacterium]|nr:hypothetical protein [Synergistaceae bacterium]